MTETKIEEKIEVSIRIEFIHRPIKKRFLNKKYPFLIQNEPFEYGIRVTNIGKVCFSGALVSKLLITILSAQITQEASKKLKIRPLNPGEVHELYLDKFTMWHEGPLGISCSLVPENDNEILNTFQHHRDHNIDEEFKTPNKWWQDYYCQGQQQLLQTTTNNLILLLTIITVVEALIGLKEVFQFILHMLATVFSMLSSFFSILAG